MTQNGGVSQGSGDLNLVRRASLLFLNFFLIILAYYQVKGASRSLLFEAGGEEIFPWVWILSALTLGTFVGFYHRLVERLSRLRVVLGSLVLAILLLIAFWFLVPVGGVPAALCFYIFIDIFSVILVEQFWSLTNTTNETGGGRKTYWFIGSGGLVGGALGSALASIMVRRLSLDTVDLFLSCAAILGLILLFNLIMGAKGLYEEVPKDEESPIPEGDWRVLVRSRYLILIAGVLFCAQMAQPVVEYQFVSEVGNAFPDLDARTVYFNDFFVVLGIVAIAINLTITPLVHRYLGVMGGLLVQPIVVAVSSAVYLAHSTLLVASFMKISDRGLSYSINRASKEQLYIPVSAVQTFQAKAWIDMLGYRLFKVAGSGLILGFSYLGLAPAQLGWLAIAICMLWVGFVLKLAGEYHAAVPVVKPWRGYAA